MTNPERASPEPARRDVPWLLLQLFGTVVRGPARQLRRTGRGRTLARVAGEAVYRFTRASHGMLGLRILGYHVEAFLTPYWTNLVVDVSHGLERRRSAAAAHASQAAISRTYVARFEWVARLVGEWSGVPAAECYWSTDLQGLEKECAITSAYHPRPEIGRWGGYRHLPWHLRRTRRIASEMGRTVGAATVALSPGASGKS